MAQEKIKRAFISVGGIGLSGIIGNGSVAITRADSEITELDIQKVEEIAEAEINPSLLLNRKIINSIAQQYKIDGKVVVGRPVGMKGVKLEAKILFITCLARHLDDLEEVVQDAGIDVIDVMPSPIAASFVTLSKTQKIAGCVLANIGAETLSIVVFENGIPISLEVFEIGSTDITNDIALGLKIPLEEAEQIKIGGITQTSYPKRKLDDIINARVGDMFELIEAHLKKLGRNGLLPAGIVITGGGSGIGSIVDLAKTSLKLPSRIAGLFAGESDKIKNIKDSTWSVAYGLCILGSSDPVDVRGNDKIKVLFEKIISWFKQFLP